MLQCMWDTQIPLNFDWCSMISHPLWHFKLISGYISSLQDFCVYWSRPKTDRSVWSNLIHGLTNGPIDQSGPIPSQKLSVLCIGLDRGPDRTKVVHPWSIQEYNSYIVNYVPSTVHVTLWVLSQPKESISQDLYPATPMFHYFTNLQSMGVAITMERLDMHWI